MIVGCARLTVLWGIYIHIEYIHSHTCNPVEVNTMEVQTPARFKSGVEGEVPELLFSVATAPPPPG
jgi:hypothetical protein